MLTTPEPPILLTARLRLVPGTTRLLRAVLASSAEVEHLLGAPLPLGWPSQDLRGFLGYCLLMFEADPAAQGWGVWVMVRRDDPAVVGDIGFKGAPDSGGMIEIGYSVVPAAQKQGYATEAGRALLAWAFAQPAVRQVTATCLPDNRPSIRVLEKLGMQRTGTTGTGMLAWAVNRPSPAVTRLHHVQITIPRGSEDEARRFYCEFLGLPEIEKPESLRGRGGFWAQLGAQQLHVGTEDGVERHATKAHLAYQVDDLAAWRARLDAHGFTPLESVPIPGYDRLEFRDPFGNRIELIQPLG
ncbi:MAG: GNAT family N-acetyltransferase [Chloroflexi bacterium]|nr:GNAT family N-acetyltransferase [Chloroflexota bacterium]